MKMKLIAININSNKKRKTFIRFNDKQPHDEL